MEVSEFLKNAKALIDTPEKWTRNAYARDAGGNSTDEVDPRAVCFCTTGAMYRAAHDNPPPVGVRTAAIECVWEAIETLTGYPYGAAGFNDAHSHPEVMEMFDIAIEKAVSK